MSFAEFHDEAERIAGFLEQRCGVRKGDRVLLLMQNSPQFMIGYYGILRANAVVVPLNPMNLTQEILRYAQDAAANTLHRVAGAVSRASNRCCSNSSLKQAIVAAYSDYLKQPTTLGRAGLHRRRARIDLAGTGSDPVERRARRRLAARPADRGTGRSVRDAVYLRHHRQPKGCMHTHRTVMHTTVGGMQWFALQPELTLLAVAPMFHVTGMQGGMNGPLFTGNTMVLLPRWDREVAAQCVQRYQVTSWTAIPTMIQDFFANPDIDKYDLSSIRRLSGGGAAMPAAVAQRLLEYGHHLCTKDMD